VRVRYDDVSSIPKRPPSLYPPDHFFETHGVDADS
jgi:hypothetical protein